MKRVPKPSRIVRLAAALFVLGIVATAAVAAEPKPQPVDFAHDIVPLIKTHCAKCHTDGTYKGSFSLDTRQAALKSEAIAPGKSGDSELVARIVSDDPEERMPPKGDRLKPEEVALLKAWIDQGLPWDEGFTFKSGAYVAPLRLGRPKLPPAHEGRDHPVDRIVDAYLARNKVARPA